MTDAQDRAATLVTLLVQAQPTVEPTLTTTPTSGEVDVILDRNKRGSRWSATAYVYGDVVFPTVRNGHRYMVTLAGTAVTEPTWPTEPGSTITSGAEFEEIGSDFASVYDLRSALRECWEAKAAKASEFISTQDSGSEQMIFDHCQRQVERYQTPMVV